jgi:hypothetical protein
MASRHPACQGAAVVCLLAAAGCASQLTTPAAAYLAIAVPANHQLDREVSAYDHNAHTNLAAAEAALRAEAATEREFDKRLLVIGFRPRTAATARALVRANQHRIDLTEQQARSSTIAGLLSLTRSHRAADAAVEVQVRIIRRELGLPPPENS